MPWITKKDLSVLKARRLRESVILERLEMTEQAVATVVSAAQGISAEVNKLSEVMQISETMERIVALLNVIERRQHPAKKRGEK